MSLFVVLGGRFKMLRALPNGRSVLLGLLGPGDPVGLSGLGGRPSDATVVALEPSSCLEVPHPRLLALFAEDPALLADILPVLTARVAECRSCAVEGTFLRVEPRLARIFLRLGASIGRREGDGVLVPVPLSRQDLADMAGTTLETGIRVMSRWGKEGVVETRPDGFLLRDPAALAALCDG